MPLLIVEHFFTCQGFALMALELFAVETIGGRYPAEPFALVG